MIVRKEQMRLTITDKNGVELERLENFDRNDLHSVVFLVLLVSKLITAGGKESVLENELEDKPVTQRWAGG